MFWDDCIISWGGPLILQFGSIPTFCSPGRCPCQDSRNLCVRIGSGPLEWFRSAGPDGSWLPWALQWIYGWDGRYNRLPLQAFRCRKVDRSFWPNSRRFLLRRSSSDKTVALISKIVDEVPFCRVQRWSPWWLRSTLSPPLSTLSVRISAPLSCQVRFRRILSRRLILHLNVPHKFEGWILFCEFPSPNSLGKVEQSISRFPSNPQ